MPEKLKKILIMEDEKAMARALELKLKHAGFDAIAVFDGEQGLSLLAKDSFSLILLDLIMPKLDGFKVLEALVEKKDKTPVIVLSNLSQADDEKRARSLGAKGFFIKSNTPIAVITDKVIEFLK